MMPPQRQGPTVVPVITLTPESDDIPRFEKEVLSIIRIGRASESPHRNQDNLISYRSRVISRHHAEIWADEKGEVREVCFLQSGC